MRFAYGFPMQRGFALRICRALGKAQKTSEGKFRHREFAEEF